MPYHTVRIPLLFALSHCNLEIKVNTREHRATTVNDYNQTSKYAFYNTQVLINTPMPMNPCCLCGLNRYFYVHDYFISLTCVYSKLSPCEFYTYSYKIRISILQYKGPDNIH